jgi:ferrous iron transport protein B
VTLLDTGLGEKVIITKVRGRGAFRKRITEMGFIVGKEVTVIKKAPLQDPVEYNIMGYNVSLRNSEARLIEVENLTDSTYIQDSNYSGTFKDESGVPSPISTGKVIHVALVGNPNSGKTTLFNFASGSKERVGNYSGVTVDAKEARFRQDNYEFIITDLPGTYSITAYTPEELYVRDFIFDSIPDVVVNVVDGSNLERNLYLTTQLIDMDIRLIVALNM